MKAIRVEKFGGPEVLQLAKEVPVPKPGPRQVLVRVKAAGVNPVDTYTREGLREAQLPFIPGKDGAGIVTQVGDEVSKTKVGDRVYFFWAASGSYAEYCVVDELGVAPLTDQLSFYQGAAIGVPYFTAYRALVHRSNTKPGNTVLIHGASGAVGLACCQVGRQLGFKIIGTAGTEGGLQLALKNGAHKVFNHNDPNYIQQITADVGNVDVIVEMLANVNLEKDCNLLGKWGQIVVVGSRGSLDFSPRVTMGKELTITGVMLPAAPPQELQETASFLSAGQEAGWLNPVVERAYPFEQAAESHYDVIAHTSGSKGKIVLDTDPTERSPVPL